MKTIILIMLICVSNLGFSQVFSSEKDRQEYEKLKGRKPDIVSVRANLDDYYLNGVWKNGKEKVPKITKGKVILGKMTIRYIP